ncbi:MAG TPA: thioredoxin family protein [Opitutales bacterium]|nr:thioredoxin family protein [Opitutales bacterium]
MFFALAAAFLSGCAKAPLVWTDDYAAALKQAKAENKKVLLNFTGSDWCVNCFRLDDEVFSQPKFADYARDRLVLVTVDFPLKKRLPDAVTAQNSDLQVKYQVENSPTLILIDPDEHELAWIEGYHGEGVAGIMDELDHPKPLPKTKPASASSSAPPMAPPAAPTGATSPQ